MENIIKARIEFQKQLNNSSDVEKIFELKELIKNVFPNVVIMDKDYDFFDKIDYSVLKKILNTIP